MKKSVELRKDAEAMRNKIKNLKLENKIEEAHGLLQSLKDIENKIREAELEESLNAGGRMIVIAFFLILSLSICLLLNCS